MSLELLTVMNINLNGNTRGSFPVVSKFLQADLQRTPRTYLQ